MEGERGVGILCIYLDLYSNIYDNISLAINKRNRKFYGGMMGEGGKGREEERQEKEDDD